MNNNYQYKAFGIPWLGLKRGLEDDIVVSPYSTFLSLEDELENGVKNLKRLERDGGLGKYGFYESIDYTPTRVKADGKAAVDAAAVPDETASQGGFPAGTPAEGAADAIPEKTPPPPALETEVVGAEPLPPDEEESLWNVPPAREQLPPQTEAEPATAPAPEKTDRQAFFDLNFNELDRDLTAEERQEWNSIYASYRGRSALTGKIIGVDPLSIRDRKSVV